MSLATDPLLAPLPPTGPRSSASRDCPAGSRPRAATAGIKASGNPDLVLVVGRGRPGAGGRGVHAQPVRGGPGPAVAGKPRRHRRRRRHGWVARAVIATSGSRERGDRTRRRRGPGRDRRRGRGGARLHARRGRSHLSTGRHRHAAAGRSACGSGRPGRGRVARRDRRALQAAAVALRTTDSTTKTATTPCRAPGRRRRDGSITVSGIAKGVGMIHPRMATMLSVILTDATADPATLRALLAGAASRTWNQLSVDGDTRRTTPCSSSPRVRPGPPMPTTDAGARAALGAAIEAVARDLARQQAADGEGATALITCQVTGAADDADARAVARAVVASQPGQGRGPRPGRELGADRGRRGQRASSRRRRSSRRPGCRADEAAARAGQPAAVDPARLRIAIAGHLVYDGPDGGPQPIDKGAARESDGRRGGPHPPRPRPGRRDRRSLRLRPDRGVRPREQRVHNVSADRSSSSSAGRRSPSSGRSSRRSRRSRASGRSCSSTAAASG